MSAFAPKRKARIIQTHDEEEDGPTLIGAEERKQEQPLPSTAPLKFGRKSQKPSGLRKSINVNDEDANGGSHAAAQEGEDDEQTVIRPTVVRASSTRKKKGASSRLSFGPGEVAEGDGGGESFTPKKSLSQRVTENNAIRRTGSLESLPGRFVGGETERPKYSKAYLDELQSSTPNTPQNLESLKITDDDNDEMDLDPSELEGALIVQSSELTKHSESGTKILTETEVRERKERRARLAKEQDVIALNSDDDAEDGSYISLSTRTKKPDSRLIAEDEDLGEGYDEYVEDGRLSLGRKAERDARRRHRQEMAELINTAEGPEADSDDSDAERLQAYEAAQRRAGMDGLARPDEDDALGAGVNVIPKMKPLPDLNESLQHMRDLVQALEEEVKRKRERVAQLQKDREDISSREKDMQDEVQQILERSGLKDTGVSAAAAADLAKMASDSPLRAIPPGFASDILPVERGLESFGTTPTTRPDIEEA